MALSLVGTKTIESKMSRRAAAILPAVATIHLRAAVEMRNAFIEFSKGSISVGEEVAYYRKYGKGMYGAGSPEPMQPDHVINASGLNAGRSPGGRPFGGVSWAEGFVLDVSETSAGSRTELHNLALSTPYAVEHPIMPLARAFREGWEGTNREGKPVRMRQRPIAENVMEKMRTTRPLASTMQEQLRNILEGRTT
jgi:hypothetical protein